jgi:hypothetical protein
MMMSGRTNRGYGQKNHSEFPLVQHRQADHLQERGEPATYRPERKAPWSSVKERDMVA